MCFMSEGIRACVSFQKVYIPDQPAWAVHKTSPLTVTGTDWVKRPSGSDELFHSAINCNVSAASSQLPDTKLNLGVFLLNCKAEKQADQIRLCCLKYQSNVITFWERTSLAPWQLWQQTTVEQQTRQSRLSIPASWPAGKRERPLGENQCSRISTKAKRSDGTESPLQSVEWQSVWWRSQTNLCESCQPDSSVLDWKELWQIDSSERKSSGSVSNTWLKLSGEYIERLTSQCTDARQLYISNSVAQIMKSCDKWCQMF